MVCAQKSQTPQLIHAKGCDRYLRKPGSGVINVMGVNKCGS